MAEGVVPFLQLKTEVPEPQKLSWKNNLTDKKIEIEQQKPKLNPVEPLLYFGNVYKTTPSENERIKRFIFEQTNAHLIYQHQDFAYLKIVREVKADE